MTQTLMTRGQANKYLARCGVSYARLQYGEYPELPEMGRRGNQRLYRVDHVRAYAANLRSAHAHFERLWRQGLRRVAISQMENRWLDYYVEVRQFSSEPREIWKAAERLGMLHTHKQHKRSVWWPRVAIPDLLAELENMRNEAAAREVRNRQFLMAAAFGGEL